MVLFDLISSKKQADEHSVASGSTLSTSIYSGTAKVEANYDTDPTVLYSLIQRRKWDDAVKRIKSYPAEAHTWVFRMEKNNKNKIRWRILPIHVALVFKADIAVIEALVSAYPQGVRQIDDQGMVPVSQKKLQNTGFTFYFTNTCCVSHKKMFLPAASSFPK